MATRLNSEFNYRTQVIGDSVWEKIKTVKGFLIGRKRAAALEKVSELKLHALRAELAHAKEIKSLPHVIFRLEAELIEQESVQADLAEGFAVNQREIAQIESYLKELYEIAEPTRLPNHDDDMMFEVNAENEFALSLAKNIQSEMIANGRPSPALIRQAMSSQTVWNSLKRIGLVPEINGTLLMNEKQFLLENKNETV